MNAGMRDHDTRRRESETDAHGCKQTVDASPESPPENEHLLFRNSVNRGRIWTYQTTDVAQHRS